MIEAMACGTPVLAFRCGSVPEIIDDGVTGLIVDTHRRGDSGAAAGAGARPPRRAPALRGALFAPRAWPRTMCRSIVRCSKQQRAAGTRTLRCRGASSELEQRNELIEVACRSRAARSPKLSLDTVPKRRLLHSGDGPGHAAAPRAQARRHLRRVRQPRRHRRVGRRHRRAVPLRHPLSLASRVAAQRHAAAAARLEPARRQHAADRRSHQSRTSISTTSSCCRRTPLHIVRTIFLWRDTAYQRLGDPQPRRSCGRSAPDHAVRQRLRRPVRGARRCGARAAARSPREAVAARHAPS